jgi:hypothetical protein
VPPLRPRMSPLLAAVKPRLIGVAIACTLFGVAGRDAWGDDVVSVRGAYYREASTRVIQPMVEVRRDAPSEGLDVDAHFLIDSITSASAAAGTAVDNVFTEIRDEVGLRVRRRFERSDVVLSYKYSAESDYWSHSVGASYGSRLWDDTAALRLSFGRSFDTMTNKSQMPTCAPNMTAPRCTLDTWYAGVSYSQVLSPVAIAQVSYEAVYLDGFQGNVYRTVPSFNNAPEYLPPHRLRNAITPRIAYYLPGSGTGFQLHYRFYFDLYPGDYATPSDPWRLIGNMIEGRVYQQLTPTLEVRLLFRYYRQNHPRFWCAPPTRPTTLPPTDFCAMSTDPPSGYRTGADGAKYFTSDPKLAPIHTEYPELQLVWDADALRDVPFLRWFAAGSFEISYGYYYQSDSFGNAHVLQTGYRLPY